MEKYLVTKDVDKDNIDDEIRNFYVQRAEKTESETEEVRYLQILVNLTNISWVY